MHNNKFIYIISVKDSSSDVEDEIRFWLDMMYRAGKSSFNILANKFLCFNILENIHVKKDTFIVREKNE